MTNIGFVVYGSVGYYDKELAIRREIGDRPGEGLSLSNIGLVYCYLVGSD